MSNTGIGSKVVDLRDPEAITSATADLTRRFGEVREYFHGRKIKSYMPVLTAVDQELQEHAYRIGQIWSRDPKKDRRFVLRLEDAPMIERMERVVELLKHAA